MTVRTRAFYNRPQMVALRRQSAMRRVTIAKQSRALARKMMMDIGCVYNYWFEHDFETGECTRFLSGPSSMHFFSADETMPVCENAPLD